MIFLTFSNFSGFKGKKIQDCHPNLFITTCFFLLGDSGVEPPTSSLSGMRSNQLS